MVKFVCLKFWAFILGVFTLPLSVKNSYASAGTETEIVANTNHNNDKLFLEPYLDDSSSFQLAGHRSHRSHSSHRSHYSSRGGYGGGYYKTPSTHTPSGYAAPPTVPSISNPQKTSPTVSADPLILEIQIKLKKLDFFESLPNGIYDKKTRNAIILYQVDKGLTPDGQATKELLNHINASNE